MAPKLKVQRRQTTREELSVDLDEAALLHAIRTAYPKLGLPENAKLKVRVPGGGDWSNTDLEIGSDGPLTVEWSASGEKTEEIEL